MPKHYVIGGVLERGASRDVTAPQLFSPLFEKFLYALVLYSVGMFFVEVHMGGTDSLHGHVFFLWSERAVAAILTTEVLLRFWYCSTLSDTGTDATYFKSPEMVIDLIAVLPFLVGFVVPVEYLGAVRSMRILRLLKFYRASPVAHELMKHLIAQGPRFRFVFAVVVIFVMFAGTMVHELEGAAQPDTFGQLWLCMWWSVVTLTTVGYGDMSPITQIGQFFAMALMGTGIGATALIFAITGTAFAKLDDD